MLLSPALVVSESVGDIVSGSFGIEHRCVISIGVRAQTKLGSNLDPHLLGFHERVVRLFVHSANIATT